MRLRPAPRDPSTPPPGVVKAFAVYTAVRVGFFALSFLVAAAIVVPSTTGAAGSRLLICAVIGLAASIPLSYVLGRRRRDDLTAALLVQRLDRERQDREYDERVRAARRGKAGPVAPSTGQPTPPTAEAGN